MRDRTLRRAIISSIAAVLVLVGTTLVASAQNTSEEYRQWQQAQQRARLEYQQYLRTRSPQDYREWQYAQQRAQQEYAQYQRANNRYDDRFGNNNGRFRLYSNGSYYSTDQRGVNLLRQAVRNGYSQGYRQGQTDRRYGRSSNYYDDSQYRSGTYGYQSYVARNQYQHYFQQGFQRGYEDGYNSTRQYGNGANILGSILNTIINLTDNN